MITTLLFDLDETLVVEEPAAAAAFAATARVAASRCALDGGVLAAAAREHARNLWRSAPTHEYCIRIGISSWEGLWCRFEGAGPNELALRTWAPTYRRETWRLALADQGVDDPELAEELGERFGAERRARHEVFPDAAPALAALAATHRLGLVTNGASCLQREKLEASGLARHFAAVIVSGDFGAGKPDPLIFEAALSQLDAEPTETVMLGDSLGRDVDGALAAGLEGVWLNRLGTPRPANRPDLLEISTLEELQRCSRRSRRVRTAEKTSVGAPTKEDSRKAVTEPGAYRVVVSAPGLPDVERPGVHELLVLGGTARR